MCDGCGPNSWMLHAWDQRLVPIGSRILAHRFSERATFSLLVVTSGRLFVGEPITRSLVYMTTQPCRLRLPYVSLSTPFNV